MEVEFLGSNSDSLLYSLYQSLNERLKQHKFIFLTVFKAGFLANLVFGEGSLLEGRSREKELL